VLQEFESAEAVREAQADFATSRQWGINSFPALLARVGTRLHVVTPGFRTAGEIREAIEALRRVGASAA